MGFSDMFATRNPIVLRPDSIEIDVKPVPAQNGGYWWLPASKVVLSSEWEDKNPTFKVGEAVSRSIYLKAAGVVENQLPDIKFAEIDGVKQYPDKPISMSSQHQGEVVSVKKFGNVYIPEKAGKIVLPKITIDWYNIHTGQLEQATLPAQTIKVLPSANGENITVDAEEESVAISPNEEKLETIKSSVSEKSSVPSWLWGIGAFVAGLVVSYFLFGRKGEHTPSDGDYRKAVEKASEAENLKELSDNLIKWGRYHYQDEKIHNLDELGAKSKSKTFKEELSKISKALYSGKESSFDKKQFLKVFKAEQKSLSKTSLKETPLPKLYK